MSVQKKVIYSAFIVFFIGVLGAIVFSENGYMALRRLEREEQALININEKIAAENLQLYRMVKRLKHDPKYIESVARQELGMTGKDEIILKFKTKRTQ